MKKYLIIFFALFIVGVPAYFIYQKLKFRADNWEIEVAGVGSTSSPRMIDSNEDGIQDIVIGAGGKEFEPTENGLLAIDGRDGSILWRLKARNQLVGSPMFKDITGDGIMDIFIGGRSAILYAVDGKTGDLIWEYLKDDESIDYKSDTTILNFYNPQFIPDVDGDGFEDLLVSYGGFVKALPEEKNRPAGWLRIISARSGFLLNEARMPDGKETYMSPVVYDFDADGNLEIIYGSGGETISGHLFKAQLSDLLKNDLSSSIVLDSGGGKGFIAPPLIIDVNEDNVADILVNSANGRVICIDGKTHKKLWENGLGDEFEIYTMPAPGYFFEEGDPYVFSSLGHGVWPEIDFAANLVLDARNGEIVYTDSSGTFQYASPVVFDFNEDGQEDVLFAINKFTAPQNIRGNIKMYQNELVIFDIANDKKFFLTKTDLGTNLGSTPLLCDLDGDGNLDVIYCYMTDAKDFYSFRNMKVVRMEFNLPVEKDELRWGSYMGTSYNGIY